MGVGNNGGAGGEKSEDQKQPAAHASSRKGCMKGKGGPLNASCTYKGVRQRTWGRWVSEIREPNRGSRLWLGTFGSAREAAMAYDAAARKLYGANALLNLPDEAPLPTASQRAAALAAAEAEAKYNRLILEIKIKQEFEKQIKMQMYMLMLHRGENAVGSESPFRKLNAILPEFDDSPMWVEASSTMDYHCQAICDPGIAASNFDEAIGIELKHPLVV